MRALVLGAMIMVAAPVHAQERLPPELLLRRDRDSYVAPRIPSGRTDVDRDQGQRYRGVYGSDGRRIGTIERTPYGTNTFRDNQGRRR